MTRKWCFFSTCGLWPCASTSPPPPDEYGKCWRWQRWSPQKTTCSSSSSSKAWFLHAGLLDLEKSHPDLEDKEPEDFSLEAYSKCQSFAPLWILLYDDLIYVPSNSLWSDSCQIKCLSILQSCLVSLTYGLVVHQHQFLALTFLSLLSFWLLQQLIHMINEKHCQRQNRIYQEFIDYAKSTSDMKVTPSVAFPQTNPIA